MKVIKPLRQGILFKPFEYVRQPYFCSVVFTYFSFANPDEPLQESEMWPFFQGEAGKETILDEVMPKGNSEVLVVGDCHAPGGNPVPSAEVSIAMGPVEKRIEVSGDRVWLQDRGRGILKDAWVPGEPEPFEKIPLTWQRSFGGDGFEHNPLGKGYLAQDQQPVPGESPLPNLEYPEQIMAGPWAVPAPASFGAVDMMWPQRHAKVGTYDDDYLKKYFPGLVPDTDWTFFNLAMDDQQKTGPWRPCQDFSIRGMHPEKETVRGRLPDLRSRCFVKQITPEGETFREIEMNIDTVWLFPAAEKGITVHRGSIQIETDDGSDLSHLLVAYEHYEGQTRSVEDYRRSLENRIDKKEKAYWLPREDDLAPPEQAPDDKYTPGDPLEDPRVKKHIAGMVQQAKEQQAKVDQALTKLGLDPKKYQMHEKLEQEAKKQLAGMPPLPPPIKSMDDIPKALSYVRHLKAHPWAAEKKSAAQLEQELKDKISQGREKMFKFMQQQMAKEGRTLERKDFDAAVARAGTKSGKLMKMSAAQQVEMVWAKFKDQPELAGQSELKKQMQEVLAKAKDFDAKMKKYGLAEKSKKAAVKMAAMGPAPELPLPEDLEDARKRIETGYPQGKSFAGEDFTGVDLSGLKLPGIDLKEAILDSANLAGCDLSGANLSGACLARANLEGANLGGAKLDEASLGKAKAQKADFGKASMNKAQLTEGDFQGASFREAEMVKANFTKAKLQKADFSKATADTATFIRADVSWAVFAGASLFKTRYFEAVLDGADFSQSNLSKAVLVGSRGPGAVFRGAEMNKVCLVGGADFSGADCSECVSEESNWRECALDGANFAKSVISGSDFSGAKLKGAVFTGVTARKTRFLKCDLDDANLSGGDFFNASMRWAKLNRADLRYSNCYAVDGFRAEIEDMMLEGAIQDRSQFGGGER